MITILISTSKHSKNNNLLIVSHQRLDAEWGDSREHDGQVLQARGQGDGQQEEPQRGQQDEAAWQIESEQAFTRDGEHELVQGTEGDKV